MEYRVLGPEELMQPGDELEWEGGVWSPVCAEANFGTRASNNLPHRVRRPVPPPEGFRGVDMGSRDGTAEVKGRVLPDGSVVVDECHYTPAPKPDPYRAYQRPQASAGVARLPERCLACGREHPPWERTGSCKYMPLDNGGAR